MRIYDESSANEVKAEEREYEAWQIREKNRILAMSNMQKKQSAWSKLFSPTKQTDDYLLGNIF
jgi:hypothetical protein